MKTLKLQKAVSAALQRRNTPVLVTGAGGWLGRAALEMLDYALGDNFSAQVLAFGRRERELSLRSGRIIRARPLREIADLALENPLILHFAFLTREHANQMALEEYVQENQKISALLQGFIQRNGAMGVFSPSSGAVYAGTDITQNPYGALKYADEAAFGQLAQTLGFPVVRMRIFNLSGPFINKLNSYALACIIQALLKGQKVVLRAAHPVWRGYAHVGDVLNIALGCLLKNMDAEPFDSAGEALEIGDLARRAGALLNRNVEILRPPWQHGIADKYVGDSRAFARHAQLAGVVLSPLDQQILDTADYIRALTPPG